SRPTYSPNMCTRRSHQLLCFLALPLWCAAQAAVPGVVEVDLIFPRNDTYAPLPGMPIVFAIQNPQLVASLYPSFDLLLYQLGDSDGNYSLRDLFSLDNGVGNFS